MHGKCCFQGMSWGIVYSPTRSESKGFPSCKVCCTRRSRVQQLQRFPRCNCCTRLRLVQQNLQLGNPLLSLLVGEYTISYISLSQYNDEPGKAEWVAMRPYKMDWSSSWKQWNPSIRPIQIHGKYMTIARNLPRANINYPILVFSYAPIDKNEWNLLAALNETQYFIYAIFLTNTLKNLNTACQVISRERQNTVSYTHLTLPTIYSV